MIGRSVVSCCLLLCTSVTACGGDDSEGNEGAGGKAATATGGFGAISSGGSGAGIGGTAATGGAPSSGGGGAGASDGGSAGGGGSAGANTGGSAGSGAGGVAGNGGGSGGTIACSTEATKSQCDACCKTTIAGGPAAAAQNIAACLCKPELCGASCATFCANPGAATDFGDACKDCYFGQFYTPSYQQCFLQENANCQSDPVCSAYSACITSCMSLP